MNILTKNFDLLQSRVAGHIAADELIQGGYWEDGKGGFIGCTVHSNYASDALQLFGITEPIMLIAEDIFEALPIEEAKAFFAAFPDAIERNGKDLSKVHWQFHAAELRELPKQEPKIQAIIDAVIEGMDLRAAGKEWSNAPYVAGAADAVIYSPALSAIPRATIYAAACAVFTADAGDVVASGAEVAVDNPTKARLRQRDTLLRLIKEAPVPEPKP